MQIGYQDYSNFNNYQDLAPPVGASPQPPIRRHHLSGGGEIAYGYAPGSTIPIPLNQAAMHSPGGAGAAIYGNFEEAPQGYLDRFGGFNF